MRFALVICLTLLLTMVPPTHSTAGGGIQNFGPQVLKRMNQIRVKHGLHRLSVNRRLTAASSAHARNMAARDFFNHKGSDGSTPAKRALRQGYKYCRIAENIAKGQKSLDEVMVAWMNSTKHRDNILDREVREFSLVRGNGDIWVMNLGVRGC